MWMTDLSQMGMTSLSDLGMTKLAIALTVAPAAFEHRLESDVASVADVNQSLPRHGLLLTLLSVKLEPGTFCLQLRVRV